MRKFLMLGLGATLAAMTALPMSADARPADRTLTGAAIGAGSGAVVAGPVGAVVGGVAGAVIGGPSFHGRRHYRHCWRDSRGYRRCR